MTAELDSDVGECRRVEEAERCKCLLLAGERFNPYLLRLPTATVGAILQDRLSQVQWDATDMQKVKSLSLEQERRCIWSMTLKV